MTNTNFKLLSQVINFPQTKQTWISDASILLTAPYFSDNKFIRFSLQRDTGPVLYVVDFPKVAIENFSEEKENLNDDIEDNETELFDQTPQNKKRGGTVTLELHFVIF